MSIQKSFELWLDESGTFENDKLIVDNKMPSHVGGILYDCRDNLKPIISIAPEEGFHATEQPDAEIVYRRFCEISEQNLRLILFQNKERLVIVDDKLTYLEIITEGILDVINRLKAVYGAVHLKILVAIRKDNPKAERIAREKGGAPEDYFIEIKSNDYVKQLRSKILVNGINSGIKEDEWSIEFGSARHDKRLLLCDIVCNTFFTKDTKIKNRVGIEASEYVNRVFNDEKKTWIFSVLNDPETDFFYKYMGENRFGEAISVICQSRNKVSIKRCIDETAERIINLSSASIDLQYSFISAQVQYFINISREYDKCERFLYNLNEFLVPILESVPSNIHTKIAERLKFDLFFSLDTVYSHMGNINASAECEKKCDKLIPMLPQGFETVNYIIKYRLRKIQNQINRFDFAGAERSCTEQINQCANMKSAMLLAVDNYDMNYSELAKAFSMRSQVRTFLLRVYPEKYGVAVEDSNHAIEEFEYEYDIKRHYLTRVHLETEANNANKALEYLAKAFSKEENENIIGGMAAELNAHNPYEIMAYFRLMGEGMLRGFTYAGTMLEELVRKHSLPTIDEEKEVYHPYEIIFWKYATTLAVKGNIKAALKFYDRAQEICFDDQNDLTLICIGLAIEAEMLYFMKKDKDKELKNAEKKFQRNYQRFLRYDPPETMRTLFRKLNELEENEISAETYYAISRRVTY